MDLFIFTENLSMKYLIVFLSLLIFSSGCSLFKTISDRYDEDDAAKSKSLNVSYFSLQDKTGAPAELFEDPDGLDFDFIKSDTENYLETFSGVVRGDVKTTPAEAQTEFYDHVYEVLETLPDDYEMYSRVSDYSGPDASENRNVFIREAYVFYIKKEPDGDFHLIIGDTLNGEQINLMTAEISGLPLDTTTTAYEMLKRARRQLYERYPDFFEGDKIRKYVRPTKNFPEIEIRGSLFFDTRHAAGTVGTGTLKPETAWEIHPITYLNFLETKKKRKE